MPGGQALIPSQRRRPPGAGWIALLTLISAITFLPSPPPAAASDTSTRWDRFSESAGCEEPFTRTPVVSKTGGLGNSEAILGPFGTYFGRSISQVRSRLRTWVVPFSGGIRVKVHEETWPALQRVRVGLEAHAREGRIYHVSSAWAFTPRTIAGSYRISRHAMGTAIDLNPTQNPFRNDPVLITDMPDWYVDTWKEAGFCWGGDWRGSKDPMHFSWMGPAVTPFPNDSLDPIPPATRKTAFRGPVDSHRTEFGPVMSRYSFDLADANSNGAPDVVGLRSHPGGTVVDMALSSLGYGACSIGRWFVDDTSLSEADHFLLADIDGDSGQDLVALTASGESLAARTATKRSGYEDIATSTTGASADAAALAAADFDGDHRADLWEVSPSGSLRIWRGPGFTQLLDEAPLPAGAPTRIAAGDRDGGDTPELYALYPVSGGSRIDVLSHDGSWAREARFGVDMGAGSVAAIGAGDYDGDGRADAQVLSGSGVMTVYLGNSSTGVPATRWFEVPDPDCDDRILLSFRGTFMDDDSSTFEGDIESIAAAGVTKGCNPPFNDMFCPRDDVSREQMAAFLVRALGLSQDSHPGFTDVPEGSTFAADIGKLATAGITKGCNPPRNDEFCPDDQVSREQMAAFLTRALGLNANTHRGFADVPGNDTFAADIGKLATAGITKGCNPPRNDRFCPDDSVTRGQMAAFLNRAGWGS